LSGTRRIPVACGVDIGSTNTKVVVLARDGSVMSRASRPTPRDALDLSIHAGILISAVEEMVLDVCGHQYQVHAIATSGVGEDGVLLDADLRPMTTALAWFDPRRQAIFRSLRPHLRDDESFDSASDPVRTIVGWKWSSGHVAPSIRRTWAALADLPAVLWSGVPFISDTLASRTAAWSSKTRVWAADRVELTLGSLDYLPAVIPSGEIVGDVRSERLARAGVLASDAVTVAGGHDHPVGGWGVNQVTPGSVLDSMGTAEVIVAQSTIPQLARRDDVDVAPGIQSAGTSLLRVEELARNVAWASQDPAVATQIHALLEGRKEPRPVLDSEYFVPGERGGGRPSYRLDVPSDPAIRASAVLGALAHSGKEAVDAVRGNMDPAAEVRLAGGWVLSPGWVRIKAMINGYPTIPILEPEVTAVATALLAARARGWTPDATLALSGTTVVLSR
jgi:sugar (pentulose or hexulose) kinase